MTTIARRKQQDAVTIPLERESEPLSSHVEPDELLVEALRPFDLTPDTPTEFYPWKLPEEIGEFGVGIIVGASGSGKSTLLSKFGDLTPPRWDDNRAIVSHFESAEEAADRLYAVGLNSVPVWKQPYSTLSNGQRFRADLARHLQSDSVVDEFTSVVDRTVAASASRSLRTHVTRRGIRNLVLSSCHRDVVEWLQPDFVIDTDAGVYTTDLSFKPPLWWADFTRGDEVARVHLS